MVSLAPKSPLYLVAQAKANTGSFIEVLITNINSHTLHIHHSVSISLYMFTYVYIWVTVTTKG